MAAGKEDIEVLVLGQGVDLTSTTTNKIIKKKMALPNITNPNELEIKPNHTVSFAEVFYKIDEFVTKKSLGARLEIPFNTSTKFSAGFNASSSSKKESTELFCCVHWSTIRKITAVPPSFYRLNDVLEAGEESSAKDLLSKNPAEFTGRYGDGYVDQIQYAQTLTIIVTFKSKDSEKQKELETILGSNFLAASAEAKLRIEKFLKKHEVQLHLDFTHKGFKTKPQIPSIVPSLDSLCKLVDGLKKEVRTDNLNEFTQIYNYKPYYDNIMHNDVAKKLNDESLDKQKVAKVIMCCRERTQQFITLLSPSVIKTSGDEKSFEEIKARLQGHQNKFDSIQPLLIRDGCSNKERLRELKVIRDDLVELTKRFKVLRLQTCDVEKNAFKKSDQKSDHILLDSKDFSLPEDIKIFELNVKHKLDKLKLRYLSLRCYVKSDDTEVVKIDDQQKQAVESRFKIPEKMKDKENLRFYYRLSLRKKPEKELTKDDLEVGIQIRNEYSVLPESPLERRLK